MAAFQNSDSQKESIDNQQQGQAKHNCPTYNRLDICEIHKLYNQTTIALNNVSLSMENGMFGLLGPNGAGKSTLMRSIATLQTIDSGSIKFNLTDIAKTPNAIRQVLGYLPQEFGVYPNCSAEKLLHHFAVLKGIHSKDQRNKQIDYLLDRTNLAAHRKIAVSDYSGGMRQRFGIAQALLGKPRILVVDEPTAGLDPHECHRFHNLLCEVAESMIVLFSTHIVEDIQNLCSQLAVIDHGKIVFNGSPDTLINTLVNKLWSRWVSQSDLISKQQNLNLISTRLHCGKHQLRTYAESCPEQGFEQTEPDLQDAYFYLLQQEKAKRNINAKSKFN
jgi:ABC-2 type transport system ATP-binding protein